MNTVLRAVPSSSFPVRCVHQIEVTSMCNLRCKYCTHPKMPRAKQHMDRDTYTKALSWAFILAKKHGPSELNLAGIGESTMHPDFVEYVAMARETMGPSARLLFATNGLLLDDALCAALAPYKPLIWVSAHRPEKAGPAVEAARRFGLLAGVSADPTVAATNWAGQVDYHVSAMRGNCDWVRKGYVMVMSDGRVTTCSFDSRGAGVLGTVDDDMEKMTTRPYSLCSSCHLDVGVPH